MRVRENIYLVGPSGRGIALGLRLRTISIRAPASRPTKRVWRHKSSITLYYPIPCHYPPMVHAIRIPSTYHKTCQITQHESHIHKCHHLPFFLYGDRWPVVFPMVSIYLNVGYNWPPSTGNLDKKRPNYFVVTPPTRATCKQWKYFISNGHNYRGLWPTYMGHGYSAVRSHYAQVATGRIT